MQTLVSARQLKVPSRGFLRLLDEPVQQNHSALAVDIKQNPSDPISAQVRTDFVEAIPKRAADRHPDRPAEFDRLNVDANLLAVFDRFQFPQPLPNRFPTRRGAKEDRRDALQALVRDRVRSVPDTVQR